MLLEVLASCCMYVVRVEREIEDSGPSERVVFGKKPIMCLA